MSDVTYHNCRYATAPPDTAHRDVSDMTYQRTPDISDLTYHNCRCTIGAADTTHRDVSDMTYHRV